MKCLKDTIEAIDANNAEDVLANLTSLQETLSWLVRETSFGLWNILYPLHRAVMPTVSQLRMLSVDVHDVYFNAAIDYNMSNNQFTLDFRQYYDILRDNIL